ncbi:hypothetical protein CQW23_27989 [Capsicum baccatum]|uniref:Ubiquitin-like protease family profile domain-containing protein n=1 Tax=Capsicum baccatum TaxID=33114 RepID=A0A2G2VF94_CAPBA|nr:hypothetical protein CQW23_27989 [Capsicum baccatum]
MAGNISVTIRGSIAPFTGRETHHHTDLEPLLPSPGNGEIELRTTKLWSEYLDHSNESDQPEFSNQLLPKIDLCDFKAPNKLMSKYYPAIEKEIGMVYFIIRILVFDLPRNYISKFYFDLVESGEYLNYDWGNGYFRMLYKSNSHGLKTNPSSFTFGGFHLALQIWFYECCLNDKAVAIRSESVMSPPILNWRSSKDLIFNEYLKTTMFKRYSNEYQFKDIGFTDEEMVKYNLFAIHQDSFVHQEQDNFVHPYVDNEKNSSSNVKDEQIFDMKNELWVCAIEQQWLGAKKDIRYISPEHYVGQYIRGFKMLANVSWDIVDNIIIPVNVSESFHWIMILFRIRHRCLYVYDSFIGGALNTKNVHRHVQSLATIIPLFLFATDFYDKRADICWDREPAYIDKSMADPVKYVIVRNIPQQAPQSNHGLFDISINMFNSTNHRMRYSVLLWDYARKKQNDDAISESEVTDNVTSRLGGSKILRDVVSSVVTTKIRNR